MSYNITGQENWKPERFSNPSNHNPTQYIYIITAVAINGKNSQSLSEHLSQIVDQTKNPEYTSDPEVDIVMHPEKIADKGVISASVITPQNTATFRDIGYILKVPKENIIAASNSDLYINNCSSRANIDRFYGSALPSPEEITKYNGLEGHLQFNEIVVLGNTQYGKVEIAGVFYKTINGHEREPNLGEQAIILSERAGSVPIVPIEEPEKKIEDKIDTMMFMTLKKYRNIPNYFAINIDGIRYVVKINEEQGGLVSLSIEKITDMVKLTKMSVDKSDIIIIQDAFRKLIQEKNGNETYQKYHQLFGDIVENLPQLISDASKPNETLDNILLTINERIEKKKETLAKSHISVSDIGRRTYPSDFEDKQIITEILNGWKSIERGDILRDD